MKDVYITKISRFLPNAPVDNEQMEEKLGIINGQVSKARRIVLRNNRIKERYYAIDENGDVTHNNAQLTAEAIARLCDEDFTKNDIELLSCGTSSPDQILPSHTSMVHGFLKNGNIEINSPSGACCSGMNALKYGYLSVMTGQVNNAACAGSERTSSWMKADVFANEVDHLKELEDSPILAFNKEFLRWMLSDGAGAVLLESEPKGDTPLKIEWMDGYSYASEMETCMYAGAEKIDGKLKGWSSYNSDEREQQAIMSVKQDVRLLNDNVVRVTVEETLKRIITKRQLTPTDYDYFLPHYSSKYFRDEVYQALVNIDFELPFEKWFTNLAEKGNTGSASIFIMLEELFKSGELKAGQKLLCYIPESGRFSSAFIQLTVV